LSAAICSSASCASISDGCTKIVDRAALQAVERTLPIGQTMVLGRPFAVEPGVLRLEVEVFGPETLVYEVDTTIDSSCRVLEASTRLESKPNTW
jgi:hypothetical protein